MLTMTTLIDNRRTIQYLELFSGASRLSRLAKSMGYRVEAHDIGFDDTPGKSCMDINESAGFLKLGFKTAHAQCYLWLGLYFHNTCCNKVCACNTKAYPSWSSSWEIPPSLSGDLLLILGGDQRWNQPKRCPHPNGGLLSEKC